MKPCVRNISASPRTTCNSAKLSGIYEAKKSCPRTYTSADINNPSSKLCYPLHLCAAQLHDRRARQQDPQYQGYARPSMISSPSAPLSLVMYILSNLSFAMETGRKHCVVEQCSSSGFQKMSVQAGPFCGGTCGLYPFVPFANGISMTLYPAD
jgi:hypothetical protein